MENTAESPKPVVVVADDSRPMVDLITQALEAVGLDVVPAADGDELDRLVRERAARGAPPNAVVSDVHMPGRTGLDVAAELLREFPRLEVILVSAFASDDLRRRADAVGVRTLLAKPVPLRALQNEVLAAVN